VQAITSDKVGNYREIKIERVGELTMASSLVIFQWATREQQKKSVGQILWP
jgi:hypothetical protein